jgi:hypothetical protein
MGRNPRARSPPPSRPSRRSRRPRRAQASIVVGGAGGLALAALAGGAYPTLQFDAGSTLDADASHFAGKTGSTYSPTGVLSPTLRGEATLLSGLALGGAAGGARAAPCPDFTPLLAGGPTCYGVTGWGPDWGGTGTGTWLPCAGGLRGLAAAGAGTRVGLDGCGALPRNLTLSARDGGSLALANVEVSAAQLGAAYNSIVQPGQSLELDAVTVSDLPGAGVVTGSLSAGAGGGVLRDPPTFRPLGGARPPPSGSAPPAPLCTRRLIDSSRTP